MQSSCPRFALILLIAGSALPGCRQMSVLLEADRIKAINRVEEVAVVGRGRLSEKAEAASANPSGQLRLLAERAARLDAYRQLKQAIRGLKLSEKQIVGDYLVANRVSAENHPVLLRGAEESTPRWRDGGWVELTLTLPIDQVVANVEEMCRSRPSF